MMTTSFLKLIFSKLVKLADGHEEITWHDFEGDAAVLGDVGWALSNGPDGRVTCLIWMLRQAHLGTRAPLSKQTTKPEQEPWKQSARFIACSFEVRSASAPLQVSPL